MMTYECDRHQDEGTRWDGWGEERGSGPGRPARACLSASIVCIYPILGRAAAVIKMLSADAGERVGGDADFCPGKEGGASERCRVEI